ncbi:MAG: ATP-binding protein [Solirubrobacterales bacterium]
MSRLPIRLRVTLAFAAAMAIVVGAVGVFLHSELGARLDESIDENLETRSEELAAQVEATGLRRRSGFGLRFGGDESFAQVLSVDGEVLASTPQLEGRPTLEPSEVAEAARGPASFERGSLPGIEGEARLLATPVDRAGPGGTVVAVVGSSLDDRDEALSSLAALLAIGGPAALLLASLAGYGAAASALRPVEAMRRRAAVISAGRPGERLPVPSADDEIARLGRTLNEMLGRLEAGLERERRFVDDASHELRTPLALHKTELEVALRYATDADELRAAIGSATEEIDRLIQLAEDLLVVARTSEGELPIARERIPVADLLATVAQRFRSRADEANRALVVEDSDGGAIDGDRIRLEQALTSIVDNALRHGSGGIRLWAHRNGDRVELHVGDRGSGFPADFIEHAFERFTRADAARTRGGSGLGLAIVDTIARAHGGRAAARNDAGGGADVWIELPALRA